LLVVLRTGKIPADYLPTGKTLYRSFQHCGNDPSMKWFHEEEIDSSQSVIKVHLGLAAENVVADIEQHSKIRMRVIRAQHRGRRRH
jgi:hypothetical protein